MPSPCGAFTFACFRMSERTSAVSPRSAASATGDGSTEVAITAGPRVDPRRRALIIGSRLELESTGAVAKLLGLRHPERMHDCQHRIGHRRAVGRLEMNVAGQLTIRLAEENQRATPMVVEIGVAHRRSIDDHRLVQHVLLAFLNALELVEEVRQHADVILVDLEELLHAALGAAMVRRGVERSRGPGIRIDARRTVATHLEGEDARQIGGEGERLKIEHDLHVLLERVGNTEWRTGELAVFAATRVHVPRFDVLDTALDLADVLEVTIDPGPVVGAQRTLERRHLARDVIEDAAAGHPPLRALLRRSTNAEQLLEDDARIANHRQRLGRRGPADGG